MPYTASAITDCKQAHGRLFRRRLGHKPEAIVILEQRCNDAPLYAIAVGGQNGLEVELIGAAMSRMGSGPIRRHHGHAVSAMAASECGGFMAVTTLSGHIGIWQLEPDHDGGLSPPAVPEYP